MSGSVIDRKERRRLGLLVDAVAHRPRLAVEQIAAIVEHGHGPVSEHTGIVLGAEGVAVGVRCEP